jgi:hypothetical protein
MSEGQIRAAIEQMEAWLADPAWEPDPAALAQWNAEFQAALAKAEKSPDWPELIGRAHAAGQLLEARTELAVKELEQVRAELTAHERGNRALRGYGASTR